MIEKLLIKNYLIIKEAEIDFSEGLNILTGETGAGKSVILDALAMILGERADYSLIKEGQDKLVVEAFVSLRSKKINEILKEILSGEEELSETLILRREILKKGISRNFINDVPVNISDMKKLGDILVDIHSQNEHQSLFNKDTHLEIIDNFCGKPELFAEYKKEFSVLRDYVKSYEDLIMKKEDLISRKSFIDFQLKEINSLSLSEDEDVKLESDLKRMENSEDISLALNSCVNFLYEEEKNALTLINYSIKELRKAEVFDTSLSKVIEDLENAEILVKESTGFLQKYKDEIDFDPVLIEHIRDRLSKISLLKRKYNLSLNELIVKGEQLTEELKIADNFDFETGQMLVKINEKKEKVYTLAKKISDLRIKKSGELEKGINTLLSELGLESAEFRVECKFISGEENQIFSLKSKKGFIRLSDDGIDEVEFKIKTNKGSDFSPLRKSASGGEISRIMLAIKTVLSENSEIPVLIFDEIDAGISGRIAQKVGKILKKLSETHQIICITHLPQIAAMSFRHFNVSKSEKNGFTTAQIKTLSKDEKINEVARLLSGENVTDNSRKSALELING